MKRDTMRKTVEVLMSTYNGEKYVEKQIETILNQIEVDVHLTIRDDGSVDDTIKIIKQLIACNPDRIQLIEGDNIGYRKSFLETFSYAEVADYYCFADQDDVWKPEKLICAIKKLEQIEDVVKLYVSSLYIANESREIISYKDISKIPNCIESYFTRGRFAGCTFVFTKELKNIVVDLIDVSIPEESMPDHDFFVASCAYAFGTVYIDKDSYIFHVRHENSVTSGGNGIRKRVIVECKNVFKRKDVRYIIANILLKDFERINNLETYDFLKLVVSYKANLLNRLKLITYKKCTCGNLLCDIENKLKIILLNY